MQLPRAITSILAILVCIAPATAQTHWPQFRGEGARGVAASDKPARPLVGHRKRGLENRHSRSRLVVADRVGRPHLPHDGRQFRRVRRTEEGTLLRRRSTQAASMPTHQWKVLCLDLEHRRSPLGEAGPRGQAARRRFTSRAATRPKHRSPMASESIATSATWACSASTWTARRCGRSRIKPQAMRYGWGTAASPVLHGGRLYFVNDNDEDSYLLALDAKTGDEVCACRATRRATGRRRSSGRTASAPKS